MKMGGDFSPLFREVDMGLTVLFVLGMYLSYRWKI